LCVVQFWIESLRSSTRAGSRIRVLAAQKCREKKKDFQAHAGRNQALYRIWKPRKSAGTQPIPHHPKHRNHHVGALSTSPKASSTQPLALIIIPRVKGLGGEIQRVEDEVLGELRFCACTRSPTRVPCTASRAESSDWPPVFLGLHRCLQEGDGELRYRALQSGSG